METEAMKKFTADLYTKPMVEYGPLRRMGNRIYNATSIASAAESAANAWYKGLPFERIPPETEDLGPDFSINELRENGLHARTHDFVLIDPGQPSETETEAMSKARYFCTGEGWVDTESYDNMEDAQDRACEHINGYLETCTAGVCRYEVEIREAQDELDEGRRVWTEGVSSAGIYFIDRYGDLYHHHEARP